MSVMTPTLTGKLRCLQTLLHQLGATVAREAVGEAIDRLAAAQSAQSVDLEKVREVIAALRSVKQDHHDAWADKLTAALTEKANG